MKIVQMNLDDFGIYHQVEWNPPQRGLIVLHGQNESGKTTLMKYVRSMLFGYLRGNWRGYFGHMDICREDGSSYRIYRNEKESYITDGATVFHEEPSVLWWHGLDRNAYDQIFAIGLEDLQGFGILANETVRSHFFSMEGGIRMSVIRRDLLRRMNDLFVASPQGKKPINLLLAAQQDIDKKIEALAYDEEEFARLQAEERKTHVDARTVRVAVEEARQQLERIAMPLAAWEVYQRGCDAWEHMQSLADVAQFPADGAQRWRELEDKVNEFDLEITGMKQGLRTKSAFREEWHRWLSGSEQIEELHRQAAAWRETAQRVNDSEDAAVDRAFASSRLAETLRLWSGSATIPKAVDWQQAETLARKLHSVAQEQEKWRAAEPKPMGSAQPASNAAERTADGWQETGRHMEKIRQLLTVRQQTAEKLAWLQEGMAGTSHTYLALSVLFVLVAAVFGLLIALAAIDMRLGGCGVAASLLLAGIAAVYQGKRRGRVPQEEQRLSAALAACDRELSGLAAAEGIALQPTAAAAAWDEALDDLRRRYLDWHTRESRVSWEREQHVMYTALQQEWQERGRHWREEAARLDREWREWQQGSGFIHLKPADLTAAAANWRQWQALADEERHWQETKGALNQELVYYRDNGEQLFQLLGIRKECTPETTEELYRQWQQIRVQAEVAKEQDRQQEERQEQIDRLEKEKEIRRQQMGYLMEQTGAATAGEFRSKVLRYKQFRQYAEIHEQSEAHLRLIAKNPAELAELRRELKVHEPKFWNEECAFYERKAAEGEQKLAAIAERRGVIVERLSRMARNDSAARLLQDKENGAAELERLVDDWLTDVFAAHILEAAQAYYERVRQPLIISRAGEYLERMTQGRYTLQASFDGHQLFAVDNTQRRVPEKQWSSGLGDQIYLAIRISLAEAFAKQIEPLPLILDDVFVRFDEVRQKEALSFLADLAAEKQLFLFTCSAETQRLARDIAAERAGAVHLFEIEKGTIKIGS